MGPVMLDKIFLLSLFFPFVSPFPTDTDVQPICGILAFIVCLRQIIERQLILPRKFIVIILFVLFFLIYNNIFDYNLEFRISKHVSLLFGLFILIAFYNVNHKLDRTIIYFSVLTYFIYTCFMLINPDTAIYIQNHIVRNTNSIDLGYRGVSTLATEPGLLGGLLIMFLFIISELKDRLILTNFDFFLLSFLVLFILFMTKSGTGYLYLIFYLVFLTVGRLGFFKSLILSAVVLVPVTVFLLTMFSSDLENVGTSLGRGFEIILMLSNPLELASSDSSIMTRVVQFYLGLISIINYPVGVGSASVDYYSKMLMQDSSFISNFYYKTGKDFGTNSSFSYMTVAYGIFFWFFLYYLYYRFSDSSSSQKFFSFLYLSVSYSAAFPAIWILLLLNKSKKA